MGSEVPSLHPIKFSPIFLWYFKRRNIVNSIWNKIKSFLRMFSATVSRPAFQKLFSSRFNSPQLHVSTQCLNLCKYRRNIVWWKLLLLCRPTWRYFGSIVKIDFGQKLVIISLIFVRINGANDFDNNCVKIRLTVLLRLKNCYNIEKWVWEVISSIAKDKTKENAFFPIVIKLNI